MNPTFAIGIDIGGTNTDIGLVRSDAVVVGRRRLHTTDYTTAPQMAADMYEAVRSLTTEHQVSALTGIGIGAPNVDARTSCISHAANIHMEGSIDLRAELGRMTSIPVTVGNDANAAVLGEWIYGGGRGFDNIMMVTLGTGVGCGIISDGRLLLGTTGAAGELGHCIVRLEGRTCGCGRQGCLETYCSAGGIVQTYRELGGRDGATLTCKDLDARAADGDPIAIETYLRTADMLGLALANAAALFSPQAIFLSGGPTGAGDLLMLPLRATFEKNLLHILRGTCTIELSQLPHGDAALLGAAALTQQPVR